ncbi:hypothetical protein HY989_07065 [Candidatus Micrarchaeota archaeon]|nr:hypothetical protein [Candidatus Micrarchaeota archaeon]
MAEVSVFSGLALFKFSQFETIAVVVLLIIAAIIVFKIVKKMIVNSILGIVAVLILQWLGLGINMTALGYLIVAIFGLFGVALLVVFKLLSIGVP